MAHAIANVTSTILVNAEPTAGAEVSVNHTFGAVVTRGLWIYTKVTGSGFGTTDPSGGGNPRLMVSVYPRPSAHTTVPDSDPAPIRFEHSTPENQAYHWSDFWPGQVPQFANIRVKNLTPADMGSNVLSVRIETVEETTA